MLLDRWFKNSAVACFVAINVFSVNGWMFYEVKMGRRMFNPLSINDI